MPMFMPVAISCEPISSIGFSHGLTRPDAIMANWTMGEQSADHVVADLCTAIFAGKCAHLFQPVP